MMGLLLNKVTVSNFRSIRGEISVPLDAPVVLIHGRNGVGKTSLLSAIELALTGDVSSLRKIDANVSDFLLHRETDCGEVTLSANIGASPSCYQISRDGWDGHPILDRNQAHFFSERCYLAQAALSKLLEIYQHQDTRHSESPLTKFVKDLLQLDQYDSLIQGLHVGGNVRRLRETAPLYWAAREKLDKIDKDLFENFSEQISLEESIRSQLTALQVPPGVDTTPNHLLAQLASMKSSYSAPTRSERVTLLTQLQHQLAVASNAISRVDNQPGPNPAETEQEVQVATKAYDDWAAIWGAKLDGFVGELGQYITTSSAVAVADPAAKRQLALTATINELARLDNVLAADEAANVRLSKLSSAFEAATARVAALDKQISAVSVASGSLAEALSAISAHIHSEVCPVCERDYSEVSKQPLGSHLANRIASLVEAAARLQALSQERAASLTASSAAQRDLSTISAQVMQSAQRDEVKLRRARLAEIKVGLENLEAEVNKGINLSARRNAAIHSREVQRDRIESLAVAQATLNSITEALGQPLSPREVMPEEQAARLSATLEALISELSKEQAKSATAVSAINDLELVVKRQIRLLAEDDELSALKSKLERAKLQADSQIEVARTVARAAKEKRASIVRRVFNDDLNAIWKALFVRLAPDEDFVPAFALPENSAVDVEAILETHYRAGGKGGNPRAMLSAGNLNTAALTLFLSLHLSVRPTLPCLIVDDPVQSMDEVHISQFAALLRTLAREHNRQIVIAVHERSLFDYLALELTPASPDDRLITAELERAVNGLSSIRWEMRTFEKDNAIAA